MISNIVSFMPYWEDIYKKALPLALSQERCRKIKELSNKLLDIVYEKISLYISLFFFIINPFIFKIVYNSKEIIK